MLLYIGVELPYASRITVDKHGETRTELLLASRQKESPSRFTPARREVEIGASDLAVRQADSSAVENLDSASGQRGVLRQGERG